jgi:hypothetical protein
MKQRTNLILLAVVLILLIITGWALFKRTISSSESTDNPMKDSVECIIEDNGSYSCIPEGSCQVTETEDGVKLCMPKYKA